MKQPRACEKVAAWARAGGRCCFPDCRKECVRPDEAGGKTTLLGQVSHIVARQKGGPRGDTGWPNEEVNALDNLMLLCLDHHKMVDDRPDKYPPETLKQWKAAHEAWVRIRLTSEMPDVGFAELETVTRAVLDRPATPSLDFDLTAVMDKMRRNRISDGAAIQLGLCKAREVEAFTQSRLVIEPDFADRLLAGLVAAYERYASEGLFGDALLDALRDYACQGRHEFKYQAAALAVVVYYFEKCDLFEK